MRTLLLIITVFLSGLSSSFADDQKPATVTNIDASTLSGTEVRLSWSKPSDNTGVVGYNLYRNDRYFTTVYARTDYIDNELSPNREYNFYIVAFDEHRNYSSKSESVVATTGSYIPNDSTSNSSPQNQTDSGRPDAPTALQATVQGGSQVQLTWNKPPGDIEGYNLYRNSSYFTTVKGSTSYLDTELNPGQSYRFQVTAFNNGEYSTKSAEVGVTTGNAPSPPPPNDGQSPSAPVTDSGSAVPDDYRLVFNDEFNNGEIDASKWNTRYRWGPDWIINNEEQYYVDIINDPDFGRSPFYFDNGKLNISASRTPDYLLSKANNRRYLSGAMTTHNKFKMHYGYVEMRAKLPRGKGLWPAFWLLHEHNSGNRPEIDVMELLGDDTHLVYQTYHHYDNSTLRSTPSFQVAGPDFSSDFHTFGMKWEPGRIIWYVDGQESNRYESGNVANEEMYLLMNVALGGSWAGSPDGSTRFPATFVIDYVRAYQRR